LPADTFTVPAGFTRQEMPNGGAGGGMSHMSGAGGGGMSSGGAGGSTGGSAPASAPAQKVP